MKYTFAFCALLSSAAVLPALAQSTTPPATPPADATPAPAPHKLMFHAPSDSSSGVLPLRVGGGSRGSAANSVSVETLVPDQIAWTTQAQPTLYWYQSKEAPTRCEVTFTEPKNPKPLLSLKSAAPTPAGIHELRLSKTDVKLKTGVVYRWSVAVIVDPDNRSQDVIANGVIKRVEPSADLTAKLEKASDTDKADIYAENGIWYDALQSISEQIKHDPDNASLRQRRVDLLNQVGVEGGKMETKLTKSQ